MPVPRKLWLHSCVVIPAALARRCTICQALVNCTRPCGRELDGLEEGNPPGLAGGHARCIGPDDIFDQQRRLWVRLHKIALQRVVQGISWSLPPIEGGAPSSAGEPREPPMRGPFAQREWFARPTRDRIISRC
jgi:hypothetical protein